jgi:seryl-tRNA(Sec) selenium transferase
VEDIYGQLCLRTIINAKGTSTRVSCGIMPIEAAQAMYEASQSCVDMLELQARASEIIAEIPVRKQVSEAVSERTAAIVYVAQPRSLPALADLVAIAHRARVPYRSTPLRSSLPRTISTVLLPKARISSCSAGARRFAGRKVPGYCAESATS